MNLELIQEINDLRLSDHSYTEIAEITGLARTSVVLSVRLSSIYEHFYSLKTASLQNEIDTLRSTVKTLEQNIIYKDAEIKRLNGVCNVGELEIVVSKDEYKRLNNELVVYGNKVKQLNYQLQNQFNHFENLSFIDKIKILFN